MPYRFEVSPTGRANCSNRECKDNGIKIQKNELRVGTWVESERFQTWQWRHWGCTTPKVISHILSDWDGMNAESREKDYSLLDGYDDLPEVFQEKIREALIQGHVDDEEWNGDAELNRPGKSGFRVRAGKKKTDGDGDANGDENSPTKDKSAAKKGKTAVKKETEAVDDVSDGEEEKPKPKPKAARGKKVAGKKESEDANDGSSAGEKPKAKAKGIRKTARTKKDTAEDTHEAEPVAEPKKRGRPAKSKAATEPTEPVKKGAKRKTKADEQDEAVEEKPKRGRARKNGNTTAQTEEVETEPAEKPKRGRKKAAEKK